MANSKRTHLEIERDCQKIKKAATTATTLKEIEIATGLSRNMINTTLSKHPIISKRIKSQLEENRINAEIEKKKQKELEDEAKRKAAIKQQLEAEAQKQAKQRDELQAEAQKQAKQKKDLEAEARRLAELQKDLETKKQIIEAETKKQTMISTSTESGKNDKEKKEIHSNVTEKAKALEKSIPKTHGYLIDSSITGTEGLRNLLIKICSTDSKIILTSLTFKELKISKNYDDIKAKDAKFILTLAVEKPEHFENVLIDEGLSSREECIIAYCASNKESVTLLTSNKNMVLSARMYGIDTKYIKPSLPSELSAKGKINSSTSKNSKIRTLIPAKRIGEKLFISGFLTAKQSIRVYSNGLEYNDGVRELNIGDDVYIATKKIDCITFAHYRVISLYAEENCELIYSKRIYDYNNIDLTEKKYLEFLESFKAKHNL